MPTNQVPNLSNICLVVTGGGSGGHLIPALTLCEYWQAHGASDIIYMGRGHGIEYDLAHKRNLRYYAIATGKLRRYLSIENVKDFFRFFKGIMQSCIFLHDQKKKSLVQQKKIMIFSTGGFVALPVVIAGSLLNIPVFIHEQTTHVGLANRMSAFFASKIFISFASSQQYFPPSKTIYSGYPLRSVFFAPALPLSNLLGHVLPLDKKILLFLGGGNGSKLMNDFALKMLPFLTEKYLVVLQCGQDYLAQFQQNPIIKDAKNFIYFSFLQEELVPLMKMAQWIVARSGAGTVCELMQLQKKAIYVPLAIAQKNEQWHNAQYAAETNGSLLIAEKKFAQISFAEFDQLLTNLLPKSVDTNHSSISSSSEMMPPPQDAREIITLSILSGFQNINL